MNIQFLMYRSLLTILIFITAFGSVQAQENEKLGLSIEATRFVEAVHYPAIYKAGASAMVAQFSSPINSDDEKFQAYWRRLATLPENKLLPPIVKAFQSEFTNDEVVELANFFESKLGKKVAELTVSTLYNKTDIQAGFDEAKNQFTNQEKSDLAIIMQKDVFQKYSHLVTNPRFGSSLVQELIILPEFSDLNLIDLFK